MRLQRNIQALIARGAMKVQHHDRLLMQQKSLQQQVEQQITRLDEERQAVCQIRNSVYPSGECSREKLFALQRRQATFRQKIANIDLQRAQQLTEQQNAREKEAEIRLSKRNILKKNDKYAYLQRTAVKNRRAAERCLEENDIEEIIVCRA